MSGGPGRTNFQDSLRRFPQAVGSQVPFIRGTAKHSLQRNDMSKDTLYGLGQHGFGVRGDDPPTTVSVKGG